MTTGYGAGRLDNRAYISGEGFIGDRTAINRCITTSTITLTAGDTSN
jgi:hypothetical protein